MEQETFEEFVSKQGYHDKVYNDIWITGLKDGIRWWQNRSYTEEKVKSMLQKRLQSVGIFSSEEATETWFKQYKKQ